MASPTVIRHKDYCGTVHLVVTYFNKGEFLAAYQNYSVVGGHTVMNTSRVYSSEQAAIADFAREIDDV